MIGVSTRRTDGILTSLAEINQLLTGGQASGDFGKDEDARHHFANKLTAFVHTAFESNQGLVTVSLGDGRSGLALDVTQTGISVTVTSDSSSTVKEKWEALGQAKSDN